MNRLFWFAVLLFGFIYVFIQSGTWETRYEMHIKGGLEYNEAIQSIHWDRFWAYLKDVPEKVRRAVGK